jgi:ribonuclease P protein component
VTSAGQGFPREFRLLTSADFSYVFEKAYKSSDAYLTVLARANALGHARLGLAISKRNIRHAADRNRIKRVVREGFRLQGCALGGLDIVVMARQAARGVDKGVLRGSFDRHLQTLAKRCDSRSCCSSGSTAT